MIASKTLYLVATPIGALDDMTHRALLILSEADIVACEDTRHSRKLFDHYKVNPKKIVSYHAKNLDRMTRELVKELSAGKSVAVVTDAGTPGISDPGAVLCREAVKERIAVVTLPGASAPVVALASSGFPSHRFIFEGFLPRKKGRKKLIESWKEEARTIVFFESPKRIVKTLREIETAIGDRNVCLARELTKKFEELLRGGLSDVADKLEGRPSIKGEITVVLAPPGFEWLGG